MAGVPIFAPNIIACFSGLNVAVASTTTLTVSPGMATALGTDGTYRNYVMPAATLTISSARNGANGLDTGTVANSTLYAIYAIGSSTFQEADAAIMSANLSAPVLPYNYDLYRLIGYQYTDGSAEFVTGQWFGNGAVRTWTYATGVSVLSGGTSTTFAAVNLVTAVPTAAATVTYGYLWNPSSAGDAFALRPTGSASTDGIAIINGEVAAVDSKSIVPALASGISSGHASLDYLVAASGALTLLVNSYTISL